MMNLLKSKNMIAAAISLLVICFFINENTSAAGISIDAGLTPAVNRIMFRSQIRYMQRSDHPTMGQMEMKAYMSPIMLAYGVRSDLTIMVRQAFVSKEMTMMQTNKSNGLGDLLILGKYRVARINTPKYTLGVAATLGLELPTGKEGFTSDSYDLRFGSFISGRLRSWGFDLDITYNWIGMSNTGDSDVDQGDEFSLATAVSHRFGIGSDAIYSVAPVLEATYTNLSSNSLNGNDLDDSGESVLILSPGFKFTRSSFIIESLIQIPVWQDQTGQQTERKIGFLIGIRLMN